VSNLGKEIKYNYMEGKGIKTDEGKMRQNT
jgi:hypothetical protein